jgi:hypothetical protein
MNKKMLLFIFSAAVLAALVGLSFLAYNIFFRRAPKALQKAEVIKDFPFSGENALKEWEEKIFKGKVVYRVEKGQTLSYVRATSDKAASALYYRLKLDAKDKKPVVSWKWNVDKFPEKKTKESLEIENEDDFAARVYVIFPAMFFTNSKVLEYIWSETLPEGTIGTSPYSKNIKIIVARSGSNADKKWFQEDRDIAADYMKAFGRSPEYDIGAVAFMTNTEHTLTSADAMYDEIRLGYKEETK